MQEDELKLWVGLTLVRQEVQGLVSQLVIHAEGIHQSDLDLLDCLIHINISGIKNLKY
jgi:hypothetical protein